MVLGLRKNQSKLKTLEILQYKQIGSDITKI